MIKADDLSVEHISWLVKSRSRNQESSLQLYTIMKANAELIAKEWDLSDASQGLTAVSFSLWRAVFLSDIRAEMEATVADAQAFLGNLILHNMVAYSQDRGTRDWTFLYYVNSARDRLENIAKSRLDIINDTFLAGGEGAANAKDYWTYYQNASEIAIKNLGIAIARKMNNS